MIVSGDGQESLAGTLGLLLDKMSTLARIDEHVKTHGKCSVLLFDDADGGDCLLAAQITGCINDGHSFTLTGGYMAAGVGKVSWPPVVWSRPTNGLTVTAHESGKGVVLSYENDPPVIFFGNHHSWLEA
jgi:hypothetical protein